MSVIEDYRLAAKKYRPSAIHALFVAESPPAFDDERDKSYFYFESNPGGDILFATVMEALYNAGYSKRQGTKPGLLRRFQSDGFWLVDAVEHPINRVDGRKTTNREREKIISESFSSFLERLKNLRRRRILTNTAGLVVIKRTVFDTIADRLNIEGYRVVHSSSIGFPRYHKDRGTVSGVRFALRSIGFQPWEGR